MCPIHPFKVFKACIKLLGSLDDFVPLARATRNCITAGWKNDQVGMRILQWNSYKLQRTIFKDETAKNVNNSGKR